MFGILKPWEEIPGRDHRTFNSGAGRVLHARPQQRSSSGFSAVGVMDREKISADSSVRLAVVNASVSDEAKCRIQS